MSGALLLACSVTALVAVDADGELTGSISGNVSDEHGHPIVGALVCAVARSPAIGHECKIAGGEGEYSLSGLPSATYIVEFSGSVCPEGNVSECSPEYVRQFYDDELAPAAAQTLLLAPGQTRTQIDATLFQAAIAGRVTQTSSDVGLGWTHACAVRGAEVESCSVTNVLGEYLIPLTEGGVYTVRFVGGTCPASPECSVQWATVYYNDKFSAALANRVDVVATDVTAGIDEKMLTTGERAVEEYLENEGSAQPISEGGGTLPGAIEPQVGNPKLIEEFWAHYHAATAPPVTVHCVVPRLKGDSLTRARRALRAAHCSLGKVRRSRHMEKLVVTAQQSPEGQTLPRGTAVGVKLGPAPASKPIANGRSR
jgi:hypothetical protein